jgi:cold-inducible RNA-binding protein
MTVNLRSRASAGRLRRVRLYVGNLAKDVSEQDLSELFATAGTVSGISLVVDRATGRTRGFGFVEMGSDADGERALQKLNGHTLKGRPLVVNEARPTQK